MNNLDLILTKISEKNPIHFNHLNIANNKDNDKLKTTAEEYIEHYCDFLTSNLNFDINYIVDSYLMMVKDTTLEQIRFMKNCKYRYSTLEETDKKVYSNKPYMEQYMIGLALSQFLWKNHKDIFDFFKYIISLNTSKKYLEIGCGHGMFFIEAIQSTQFKSYKAVDLSQTSINLTSKFLKHYFGKIPDHVTLQLQNIFDMNNNDKYDFIAMGEVLEHVEEPSLLLNKINQLLTNTGVSFISTCTNCPAIDHIFLFNSVDEIRQMITNANLVIISEITLTATKLNLRNKKEVETINYAALVKKVV